MRAYRRTHLAVAAACVALLVALLVTMFGTSPGSQPAPTLHVLHAWNLAPATSAVAGDAGNGLAYIIAGPGFTSDHLHGRLWVGNLRTSILHATSVTVDNPNAVLTVLPDATNGHLFVADGTTTLWMVDAATGRLLHTARFSGAIGAPTLSSALHRVYIPVSTGSVVVLSSLDGRAIASFPVPRSPISITPAAGGTRLYVVTDSSRLLLLDAANGKTLRTYAPTPDYRSPGLAVDERTSRVFVTDNGQGELSDGTPGVPTQNTVEAAGRIMTLDAATGNVLSTIPTPAGLPLSVPLVDEGSGHVFVNTQSEDAVGTLFMLDARSGRLLLKTPAPLQDPLPFLDAHDHRLLLESPSMNRFVAFETQHGSLVYTRQLEHSPQVQWGQVFLDEPNDRLYVTVEGIPLNQAPDTNPGYLLMLDAGTGATMSTIRTGWNPSVFVVDHQSGRLLLLSTHLFAQIPAEVLLLG